MAAQQQQATTAPPAPGAGRGENLEDRRSLDVQIASLLAILDKPIDFEVGG